MVDTQAYNYSSCAQTQINLYVPETQHNSFGVVRSLVTDSQDNSTGAVAQTFIDSDGQVGNDSARDLSAFMDGRWHMVRPAGSASHRKQLGRKHVGTWWTPENILV